MINNHDRRNIFGHDLPYCSVCLAAHRDTPSHTPLRFALRAEDNERTPLGYDKDTPPATCWEHTPLGQQKKILHAVLKRLKEIIDSDPDTTVRPIKLLVGIEFNRLVSDSHKHIQKLRLHIPDALLVQVSLQNVEANSAVLSGATMYQCDLNGAAFQDGFFRKANIIDTDATAVDLHKTCFEGALIACSMFKRSMFERSDFSKSIVIATSFEKSNFGLSNLTRSKFCEVFNKDNVNDLLAAITRDEDTRIHLTNILYGNSLLRFSGIETTFEKSRFSSSDLSGVRFKHICMNDSDFNDADLSGITFDKCVLSNSTFRRAQVRRKSDDKSIFKNCQIQNCDFSGAALDDAEFSGEYSSTTSLMGSNFDTASLCHAKFIGSKDSMLDMRRVNLNNSNLECSQFSFVNLDGADMTGGISLNNVKFINPNSSVPQIGCFVGSLKGVNLQGADMDDAVFSCCDFSGALMQGISAINSKFIHSSLTGASLKGSDLRGIDLSHAKCIASNFEAAALTDNSLKATLDYCDFSGATLTDCFLKKLTFNGTVFNKTKMSGVDLSDTTFIPPASLISAEMSNADLTNAMLDNIEMTFANFSNANFDKASLQGCRADRSQFTAASMKGVNLQDAHIGGADFSVVVMTPSINAAGGTVITNLKNIDAVYTSFKYANLDDANLSGGNFINANFEATSLRGVNLNKATLNDAIFKNSSLDNAQLAECKAARSVFRGASMRGVNLQKAHVEGSDFDTTVLSPSQKNGETKRSDLSNIKATGGTYKASLLDDAILEDGDFTGASFYGADLRRANLRNAIFRSCDLGSATLTGASIVGAKMISCHADFCDLSSLRQDFRHIDKDYPPFYRYYLRDCPAPGQERYNCINKCKRVCMADSSFSDCNFNNSALEFVNFFGSNLTGSSFVCAELTASNFEYANLTNSILSIPGENTSKDSSWCKSLLRNSVLSNTHLDENNIINILKKNISLVYGDDYKAISDVWRGLKVNLMTLAMYDQASSSFIEEQIALLASEKYTRWYITIYCVIAISILFLMAPMCYLGINKISNISSGIFFKGYKYISFSAILISISADSLRLFFKNKNI